MISTVRSSAYIEGVQSSNPGIFNRKPFKTTLKARVHNKSSTETSLRQYIKVELLVLTTQFFGKAPDAMAKLGEMV